MTALLAQSGVDDACSLLARYMPPAEEGIGGDDRLAFMRSIVGWMFESPPSDGSGDEIVEQAIDVLTRVGVAAGVERELASAAGEKIARDTVHWIGAGKPVVGRRKLAELIGDKGDAVVAKAAEALGIASSSSGGTIAAKIVALVDDAELLHDRHGTGYAHVAVGDHREIHRIRSTAMREWLVHGYHAKHGAVASRGNFDAAIEVIAARARFGAPERDVHLRVGSAADAVYLDLGDEKCHVVEITADGWRVVGDAPVRFRRSKGTLALPAPVEGGTLDELRALLPSVDDDGWKMIVGWLVGALHPTGPYRVLELAGEHGTAKSTSTRILRSMIDPASPPTRSDPHEKRDLAIAADNRWILAFDNLSSIQPWFSDALCRLSTGSGFVTRTLYADREEELFEATRPVILNSITELATRGDLLDRGLRVELGQILSQNRRDEDEVFAAVHVAQPRILGALCDAVACALRRRRSVALPSRTRMADHDRWMVAASPALGWSDDAWPRVAAAAQSDAGSTALEASTLTKPLRKFVEQMKGDYVESTAQDLLLQLGPLRGLGALKTQAGWPESPRGMSGALRRLAPALREAGICEVEFGARRNAERPIVIRRTKATR